jgi:hypothetical protein
MKISDFIPNETFMTIVATGMASNRHRDALNKPLSWDELTSLQKKKANQDANAAWQHLEKCYTKPTTISKVQEDK